MRDSSIIKEGNSDLKINLNLQSEILVNNKTKKIMNVNQVEISNFN